MIGVLSFRYHDTLIGIGYRYGGLKHVFYQPRIQYERGYAASLGLSTFLHNKRALKNLESISVMLNSIIHVCLVLSKVGGHAVMSCLLHGVFSRLISYKVYSKQKRLSPS